MISKIGIKNFKSIKELSFDAKKINIFIGKPATGKTSILEALGIFSLYYNHNIKEVIRIEKISDIFWNNQTFLEVEVNADDFEWIASQKNSHVTITGKQTIKVEKNISPYEVYIYFDYTFNNEAEFIKINTSPLSDKSMPFKYYNKIDSQVLFSILKNDKIVLHFVNLILEEVGLQLKLDIEDAKIKISSLKEPIVFSYNLLPETLQRFIFYSSIIKSNKNSILIFNIPEMHPHYTKILAEMIGKDNNQYFLSTYNPYFISSIIEKTPTETYNIFNVNIENFQTTIRKLSSKEKEDIVLGKIDPFFIND
ncbi:MAG: hypothetical protein QXO40_00160 [Candidatus Aenigmatarchaeota archaeon]